MIETGKVYAKLLTALRAERRRRKARRKLLRSFKNGAIRRFEFIYQQKLIVLAELKQSLLQKTVSRELAGGKEASTATLKEEEVA